MLLQNQAKVSTLDRIRVARADQIKISISGRAKVSTLDRILQFIIITEKGIIKKGKVVKI